MKSTLLAVALAAGVMGAGVMGAGAAYANNDDDCQVPAGEWQPVAALQDKLEADGWQVTEIERDDGCYEAHAIDEQGRQVEAAFNPKTFEMVEFELED